MNREIKFRCWDTDEKKMVYPPFRMDFVKDEHIEITKYNSDDDVIESGCSGCSCWGGGLTLLQSTGLKDKNGVEIYEGDIIQCLPPRKFYREVVYHEDRFKMINPTSNHPFPLAAVITSHPNAVVAGNIYENPELFNKEDE